MTDCIQTIQDDLAFVRTLAREGRRAPLLGGSILIAMGLIYAAASLIAWPLATGAVRADASAQGWVWAIASVFAFGAIYALKTRLAGRPGAEATNNRASSAAWRGVGFSIGTFALALAAAVWRLNTPLPLVMFPSFVLIVYGIGWGVAAAMSDRLWTRWVAVGSMGAAVLMGSLAGSAAVYPAYAAALMLLAALPGWLQVRDAARAA